MDVNKCSAQLERLEVVETGRRRRWSDDEKLRIVIESMLARLREPVRSSPPQTFRS
jgi:transposase